MIYRTFGRTGLKVSAAGLGAGGFSRLGLAQGKSETEVVALIRLAIDLDDHDDVLVRVVVSGEGRQGLSPLSREAARPGQPHQTRG